MAPPQESNGVSFVQQQEAGAGYGTEPKRMRLSGAAHAAAVAAAAGSSTTTRASTGAPTAMTNKGSVYKAQRGRGERGGGRGWRLFIAAAGRLGSVFFRGASLCLGALSFYLAQAKEQQRDTTNGAIVSVAGSLDISKTLEIC